MSEVQINPDLCKKDGLCAAVCPVGTLQQSQRGQVPAAAHEALCIRCGHCMMVCPQAAITVDGLGAERFHPLAQGQIPTAQQTLELLRARRSVRVFRKTPVEKEVLTQIIAAANLAPSSHNVGSTEYTVVQDSARLKQLSHLTANYFRGLIRLLDNPISRLVLPRVAYHLTAEAIHLLPEFKLLIAAEQAGQDPVLHNAPALIVFHGRRSVVLAPENANLALHNAALMAQSLGLGAFYVGFLLIASRGERAIARWLDIPRDHQIYAALAVGYPAVRFTRRVEKDPPLIRWM